MNERVNIYMFPETREKLKSLSGTNSSHIRSAVAIYLDYGYCVYSIYCDVTKLVFVGISPTQEYFREGDFLSRVAISETIIGQELKMRPRSEFNLSELGLLTTMESAVEYRDFIMNRMLDKGCGLYNSEIHAGITPRYITSMIDYALADKLVKYCISKNKKIGKVITYLIKKFMGQLK